MTNHLESTCWMVQSSFSKRGSGWDLSENSERQPLGTACLFHLALVDLCCGHQIHGGTFVEVPARQTSRGTGSSFNKGEDMRKNIAKHHAAGCFVERDSLLNDDNRGDIGQLVKSSTNRVLKIAYVKTIPCNGELLVFDHRGLKQEKKGTSMVPATRATSPPRLYVIP